MYTYYCIKVYLMNGKSGYAAFGHLTSNINSAMMFDTFEEAKSWYRKNTMNATYEGSPVDTSRCSIVSVNSPVEL